VSNTYTVWNGPMPTTAPLQKVSTGTSTKTMLQLAPNVPVRIVEYGWSFDASSAATPGYCELIDTASVFGTVTAYAVADVMPFTDPNAPANTSGSTGSPLKLGTALSGYTCTSEGSITAVRTGAARLVSPTSDELMQYPLGREWGVLPGDCVRIRMTFGTAVNALCYVVFEV
jgi:hypothetical protein